MEKHSDWQNYEHDKLIELRKQNPDWSYQQLADKLTEIYGTLFTFNAVRNRIRRNKPVEKLPNYKETVEIMADGSHRSDKLVRMSEEQKKDINFILKAHGYDNGTWELVNAKNNMWEVYSQQDGVQTLYSSRITVKPKQNATSLETILEVIKDITPIHIDTQSVETDNGLLEIPLFDTHFGISDYEHYKPTQNKIMNLLSKQWREVLFIIGQDLLHHDNFRNSTASGTAIEQVDFAKAWEDARKMYEPMIEKAIKQSMNVKICYSKGNHDESMSWAFVQMLKAKYPQCQFDDAITERKAHTFGKVFIGITHGDKARKNLHNLFPVEFPLEWSQAKTRELHTGHYHKEDANDIYGMMVRTLATRNKTDQWHKDNGFVGAHKRFMVFEYSEEELESIHYV